MSLLTTIAAGAVIFLLGAIIAIGARPRDEDAVIERKRCQGDGGYTGGTSRSGDNCASNASNAGGDCGGGDGGGD
ncbi:MAG: hypothetical protein EON59_13910 [Alphaproteobacteria bacterium]|nr:MAG: hypothetical protein EON59_13910 [Alphaproteobacteria bacterium]